MRRAIVILISLLVALISKLAKAQDSTGIMEVRPFQFTVITPIGTNGLNSYKISNQLSFNLFFGLNGGVDGLEIGSFINATKEKVHGIQMAGFVNACFGSLDGIQLAGFSNVTRKSSKGAQLSGFANGSLDNFNGLQASGFGNLAIGNSELIQIGGFGNINTGNLKGLQIAGFGNISSNLTGVQISGFGNLAENIDGAQLGVVNLAGKVKGLQLGFLNICDTIDGVPIGFLSIVKKGYRAFELWGGDALNLAVAYKLGVDKFYNIFSFGSNFIGGLKWGFGYGIGSRHNFNDETNFSIEAISYDIRNNWHNYTNNSLNQIRFNFGVNFGKGQSFHVGPVLNFLVSEKLPAGEHQLQIAPYSIYSWNTDHNSVKCWIGLGLGIEL